MVSILLTITGFVVPGILCYNKPLVLFFYYTSIILMMLGMFVLCLFVGVHYTGYSFMILLTALWLAYDEILHKELHNSIIDTIRSYAYKPFIWSILACQVVAGLFAFKADYDRPFSEGKAIAEYIKQKNVSQPLVISPSLYAGIPIAGYLNRPIYYPALNSFGTFVNRVPTFYINEQVIFKRMVHVMDSAQNGNIFIAIATDWEGLDMIKTDIQQFLNNDRYGIKEQKHFSDAILKGENYEVYWIKRNE
jgi:hypothetical protein